MRKWFVIGLCLLTLGVYAGTNEVKQMVAIFTSLGGEPEVMEESEQYVRLALGDSVTEPTFGPSGRQLRLNCWLKKRR